MTDMRQLLIEDSAFCLDVSTALRSAAPMSMQEAGKQATEILNGLWRVTRPEATQIAHALADRGHSSEVRSCEAAAEILND